MISRNNEEWCGVFEFCCSFLLEQDGNIAVCDGKYQHKVNYLHAGYAL